MRSAFCPSVPSLSSTVISVMPSLPTCAAACGDSCSRRTELKDRAVGTYMS